MDSVKGSVKGSVSLSLSLQMENFDKIRSSRAHLSMWIRNER